jgi:hypothetical protein
MEMCEKEKTQTKWKNGDKKGIDLNSIVLIDLPFSVDTH